MLQADVFQNKTHTHTNTESHCYQDLENKLESSQVVFWIIKKKKKAKEKEKEKKKEEKKK